ncbi:TetR/AcrR family transcriptional regulator [Marinoscillum pacificum]|uniref:TetR/AcrR family transcriptional regulator n=1 Tax=Marinoscillum pacificum TaxID=392723 RepID=UPI002158715F|nr:TetR/AcrR family transcriptional regulator [Marinoscillum pacificum]
MKTKERILVKALELFNNEGVKEVTLRKVAGALGISQGNLNYHFKTKGEIIRQLYYDLVDQMNDAMQQLTREQPILSYLSKSSLISMEVLYAYRFITRDLYQVLESDQELKQHYHQLQKMRNEQFLSLFQHMISGGLMREEELVGEYERLHERMNILGDNWISAADFFQGESLSKVAHYHALLFEIIYPYLTPKGKEQYLEIAT